MTRPSALRRSALLALPALLATTLSVHAAGISSEAISMGRAFSGKGAAANAQPVSDPSIAAAKALVAKSLGEDATDLVFVPITPCTVWDTRYATDPASAGAIADGQTRRFNADSDDLTGNFAAFGGNPSCAQTAWSAFGARPYAVMMTVYTSDATGNGWLTFYRDGDADPSTATVSVYYSPGPTRTQTVVSKSSRGYGTGAYDVAVTSRYGAVNASAAVTGYFLKPKATGSDAPPKWVDGNGKVIGRVSPMGVLVDTAYGLVEVWLDGYFGWPVVSGHRFAGAQWSPGGDLYFTEPNCQGDVLLPQYGIPSMHPTNTVSGVYIGADGSLQLGIASDQVVTNAQSGAIINSNRGAGWSYSCTLSPYPGQSYWTLAHSIPLESLGVPPFFMK